MADIAVFPFVRQFAAVDAAWFENSPYPKLQTWLKKLVESELFNSVMEKQPTYIA
ncbi:MAG: glutathione S-transferase C-terminal domain-containing protein [Methylotenera sp.]